MEDFSKLSDGEINRLVAERLGWTEVQLSKINSKTIGRPPHDKEVFDFVPNFTADPAAWWPLVEKIDAELGRVCDRKIWCCFTQGFKSMWSDELAGRAVCICFLKATEGKQ